MAEQLYGDPTYAVELLSEMWRDGDLSELTILFRQIGKVFGHDYGEFCGFRAQSVGYGILHGVIIKYFNKLLIILGFFV